ncbi:MULTISPECIES: hypothetical protein [Leptospira]|uniref:hypothetical protein n=1 Tax=Leptospira TaxID=171 RepID=UPI0002BF374C|nr:MULTISPECIES: hypothetical protein [Leptospira]EMJ56514.1 hypothetical protein LEP1GSC111_1234 [Leptospira interrogans str. UT126]UML78855.1 hypothetical protein FH602_02485 [Leptospira kirschneri]UMQ60485.1 hypothetical protein FH585_21425 [Leptospira interrogans]UMQ60579.1 hypothetical protein FH585_21320 [Leptospira interrogans]
MLITNSEGTTDVAALTNGAAITKDPMSVFKKNTYHKDFKNFFKKKYKKSDDKKTICVDFDGVIHSYLSGWQGIDIIPDPPVEEAFDWLFENSNYFNIIIYSSRCSDVKGIEAIKSFLNTHQKEWRQSRYTRNLGVPKVSRFSDLFQYSAKKIPAHLYLDDRGVQFKGIFPSIEEIEKFCSWVDSKEAEFFHKSQAAQAGERRTWNDGLQHEKTSSGDWKTIGKGRESSQNFKPTGKVQTSSGSSKSHAVTHEQKAVEVLGRWKEFEQKAKERNRDRIARTPPEKRTQLNDVKYSVPGDIVRIERPNSGKINRGHIAEVLGKVDDMIKIKLPSGSEFLFAPHDLAYAKSFEARPIFSYQFLKSSESDNPNIHTFSDGNTYEKEGNGWRLISKNEKNDTTPEKDKEFVEEAMKAGDKIPVKVLKNYPELLQEFPVYNNRVKSIEALSNKFLKR